MTGLRGHRCRRVWSRHANTIGLRRARKMVAAVRRHIASLPLAEQLSLKFHGGAR